MRLIQLLFFLAAFLLAQASVQGQDDTFGNTEYLIRTGKFQEAINRLNIYLELNPSDAKAYIARAIAYGNLGQHEEKKRDLNHAKHLNPFAYMYLSNASRSVNYAKKKYGYDFDNLSSEFSKSPVKNEYYDIYLTDIIDRHSQDSLITKAIDFLSVNDLANTEAILSKIKASDETLGIIYDIKGLIALKKNNLDEAIVYFTSCIHHMPDFPLAYHNRAIAYKLSGEYQAAKNDLDMALSLNEDISVFYFTLAKLSELVDDEDEAQEHYKTAIDLNPDYVEARTNYTLLQKTLGNYSESMLDLHHILDATDKDSKGHFIKGGIHLTYGEYEKAINEFDLYLDINTDDPDALFNRGLAKLLQGKKFTGCQDIMQSIDLHYNADREVIYKAFCPTY